MTAAFKKRLAGVVLSLGAALLTTSPVFAAGSVTTLSCVESSGDVVCSVGCSGSVASAALSQNATPIGTMELTNDGSCHVNIVSATGCVDSGDTFTCSPGAGSWTYQLDAITDANAPIVVSGGGGSSGADADLVNAATDGFNAIKDNGLGIFAGANLLLIIVATAAVAIGARFLPGMVRKLFGR